MSCGLSPLPDAFDRLAETSGLPSCEEPAAAIAVCRTWDGVTNFYLKDWSAYLEWLRIREDWLEGDVYHRGAVAEIDRQVAAQGEALFALNEEDDASPWGLFVMAPDPQDEAAWKHVGRLEFKSASLGEAQV